MRLRWMAIGFALLVLSGGLCGSRAVAAESFSIVNPDGGEVRGLIIGIDAYQHVRPLKGAVADARDIETTMKGMGIADVTTLIDAAADRDSVLREISALVQRTKPNDLVVLSIAGHGAQEPERVKGSEPDGMENVFLLPGFEPTAAGSRQRILGSEFNHFMRQFELRGARVMFVADTCHGGGMARDIDPRAGEMSFRQVPPYKLVVDTLQPVTDKNDPKNELDLDHTAFLAAVDRSTKAPEVRIPGIDGLRGALSYAVARAMEGGADANHDGKVTLKELFNNVRQVVYQLSDQRQNVVTMASPGEMADNDVMFELTRGISLIQQPRPSSSAGASSSPVSAPSRPATAASPVMPPAPAAPVFAQDKELPVRLAALDGNMSSFPAAALRGADVQTVKPTDNPDLIWDPASHDVIAWGDVIAYGVDAADLPGIIERTAAIRDLKRFATKSPQQMQISPDDRQYRNDQTVEVDLSDIAGRSLLLFNISGDGTVQLLYPVGSDPATAASATLKLPLRVREPFGAEQIVAITSQQRLTALEQLLGQVNRRRAAEQVIKGLQRYAPPDARIGSVGFFTAP